MTPKLNGEVYLGPTAQPAFGKENYSGLEGVEFKEGLSSLWNLSGLIFSGKAQMTNLALSEMVRRTKIGFCKETSQIANGVRSKDIGPIEKVGLRAQLYNTKTKKLEMDFVVEKGERSIHVLNAVSPGFTASFAFSQYLVDELD